MQKPLVSRILIIFIGTTAAFCLAAASYFPQQNMKDLRGMRSVENQNFHWDVNTDVSSVTIPDSVEIAPADSGANFLAEFSPLSPNDDRLSVLPEPSTLAYLALGLTVVIGARRRRS